MEGWRTFGSRKWSADKWVIPCTESSGLCLVNLCWATELSMLSTWIIKFMHRRLKFIKRIVEIMPCHPMFIERFVRFWHWIVKFFAWIIKFWTRIVKFTRRRLKFIERFVKFGAQIVKFLAGTRLELTTFGLWVRSRTTCLLILRALHFANERIWTHLSANCNTKTLYFKTGSESKVLRFGQWERCAGSHLSE